MWPTRFLTSATQTVEESKRELCLNEFIKFKTLLALHIALYISVFFSLSVALCFSLVVITMGKQQKWQFKREKKHLSTWLNTQMSFRMWLPCVHTCFSGHTRSMSYIHIFFTWENMCGLMKAGRISFACVCESVHLIHIHVSLQLSVIWSHSNIYFFSRSLSYTFTGGLMRSTV